MRTQPVHLLPAPDACSCQQVFACGGHGSFRHILLQVLLSGTPDIGFLAHLPQGCSCLAGLLDEEELERATRRCRDERGVARCSATDQRGGIIAHASPRKRGAGRHRIH